MLSATGYIGEAPQLTMNYGANDNGKRVFDYYQNFMETYSVNKDFSTPPYLSSNYSIGEGLTLGKGSGIISERSFPEGYLFGLIDYQTSSGFGNGGAGVYHGLAITNSSSSFLASINFNTYSQQMTLSADSKTISVNNFSFNNLTNFAFVYSEDSLHVTLGDTSLFLPTENSVGSRLLMENQADSSPNGTIFIPFVAFSRVSDMPTCTFGSAYVGQSTYNGSKVQNPGDVNANITFTALLPNNNLDWIYVWHIGNYTYSGQSIRASFATVGTYTIVVNAYSGSSSLMSTLVESIVGNLSGKVHELSSLNSTKMVRSFEAEPIGGSGSYYYTWFVGGREVGNNSKWLNYTFRYLGQFGIVVVITDSGGSVVASNELLVNVTSSTQHQAQPKWEWVLYNLLSIIISVSYFLRRKITLIGRTLNGHCRSLR